MDAFETLNPLLVSPMGLREGKSYRIPVKSMPSAGFVCSVEVEGDAIRARLEQQDHSALLAGDFTVGGATEQMLVIDANKHGAATLILRHARPWQEKDPLASQMRLEVTVTSLAVQEAWENSIPVAPVSDQDVRAVLDKLDGVKPYGGKKVAFVREALEIFAKDIAAHRHAGMPYTLDDWKVDGFIKLFPSLAFPRAHVPSVRAALQQFVQARSGATQ